MTDSVTMLKYNTSCELILILICYQIVIFWSTATVWHDIWLIWRLICLYLSHCLPYTSIILLLLPSSIYLFWYFHNNQVSESLQGHVSCQSNSSYKSNWILRFFNDFTWSLTILSLEMKVILIVHKTWGLIEQIRASRVSWIWMFILEYLTEKVLKSFNSRGASLWNWAPICQLQHWSPNQIYCRKNSRQFYSDWIIERRLTIS